MLEPHIKCSSCYRAHREAYAFNYCLNKSAFDLFESNQKFSVHIKETNTYKELCENHGNQYHYEHIE